MRAGPSPERPGRIDVEDRACVLGPTVGGRPARWFGSKCGDENNLGNVSTFLAAHGLADPGCWPWRTDDAAYAPTRIAAVAAFGCRPVTWIGDIDKQKEWIDTTGSIATFFEVGTTSTAIWRLCLPPVHGARPTTTGRPLMLDRRLRRRPAVPGSVRTPGDLWGDDGYVLVGLRRGIASIPTPRPVCSGLNPDPWTKRRLHNGNLYETGNGALHRNFEVLVSADGGAVRHGGARATRRGPWNSRADFGSDAATCPTLTGTTTTATWKPST